MAPQNLFTTTSLPVHITYQPQITTSKATSFVQPSFLLTNSHTLPLLISLHLEEVQRQNQTLFFLVLLQFDLAQTSHLILGSISFLFPLKLLENATSAKSSQEDHACQGICQSAIMFWQSGPLNQKEILLYCFFVQKTVFRCLYYAFFADEPSIEIEDERFFRNLRRDNRTKILYHDPCSHEFSDQ